MNSKRLSVVVATSIVGIAIGGCGGGNTDGGSQSFDGQIFVSDEDTVGRVEIALGESSLPVGATADFQAFARTSSGAPIGNMRLVCDSEAGVRILEPVSSDIPPRAFQLTNNAGAISGVIGCDAPGSFAFGCRMPTGANRRQFVTVKCSGDRPAGFSGFPGSAGGGLGGGAVTPPDEASGIIRVTNVRFTPIGASATPANSEAIDVVRDNCVTCSDLSQTPEPFSDDYVTLTIRSTSPSRVALTGVQYAVAGIGKSEVLPVTAEIAPATGGANSEATVSVLVFRAAVPFKEFVIGSGREISDDTGFKGVTFTVFGETAQGKLVSASGSTTLSFGNFNNCPTGTVVNEAFCPE
jgi:hypothetical protein